MPESPEARVRRVVVLRQGLTPEQRKVEDARLAARSAAQVEAEESRTASEVAVIRMEDAMRKAEGEILRELYVVYAKLFILPRLYRCCPFERVALPDLLFSLPIVPPDSFALAERAIGELVNAGIVENSTAAGYRLTGDAPPYEAICELVCEAFSLMDPADDGDTIS